MLAPTRTEPTAAGCPAPQARRGRAGRRRPPPRWTYLGGAPGTPCIPVWGVGCGLWWGQGARLLCRTVLPPASRPLDRQARHTVGACPPRPPRRCAGVNPRGLQQGLHRLAEGGTPARLLIIDDGWQHMGGRGGGQRSGQGEGRRGGQRDRRQLLTSCPALPYSHPPHHPLAQTSTPSSSRRRSRVCCGPGRTRRPRSWSTNWPWDACWRVRGAGAGGRAAWAARTCTLSSSVGRRRGSGGPSSPPRLSLPPGEDLQAVEPLRVMELLNRRASSALGEIDEAAASGDGQIAAGIGRA